jgi:hypothetical protein
MHNPRFLFRGKRGLFKRRNGQMALLFVDQESTTSQQAVEVWNELHYIAASCGELTLVPQQRD